MAQVNCHVRLKEAGQEAFCAASPFATVSGALDFGATILSTGNSGGCPLLVGGAGTGAPQPSLRRSEQGTR